MTDAVGLQIANRHWDEVGTSSQLFRLIPEELSHVAHGYLIYILIT